MSASLPRVQLDPAALTLPEGPVVRVPAGADLQRAIDGAESGTVLELDRGATFTGNFVLPAKLHGGVVIRPAGPAIPAGRMTPALAASLQLPKVLTPNAAPVFATEQQAHHYTLAGLEIGLGAFGGTNTLIALGLDSQRTREEIPHSIVLDRLYAHGTPTATLRRIVALNSASTAIVECWFADAHENGSDSQAILGWTGPGPYLIRGNYLEAGHEVIMFGGGGDPLIAGLVASDIEILRNHITRPVAWLNVWQVKNLLELKSAQRVLVEGNVIENNWASAQDGSGIVLKSTNQGGSCTWCGTADVTIRWNIVRNVGTAFNLAAHPETFPVVPMARVAITDNLVVGIREGIFGGSGAAFMVQGDLADVSIDRNTVVTTGDIGTVIFKTTGNRTTGFRFTDNLAVAGTNFGIYGDDTGPGTAAVSVYAPDGVVTGNLFAGASQYGLEFYVAGYPAGNRFLRTAAEVGFANAAAGDFSRAVQDSAGVDVAQVARMTAGVVEGDPPPISVPPVPPPAPAPLPAPVPVLSKAVIAAALVALDKVLGPTGRESKAIKAALAPIADYLRRIG